MSLYPLVKSFASIRSTPAAFKTSYTVDGLHECSSALLLWHAVTLLCAIVYSKSVPLVPRTLSSVKHLLEPANKAAPEPGAATLRLKRRVQHGPASYSAPRVAKELSCQLAAFDTRPAARARSGASAGQPCADPSADHSCISQTPQSLVVELSVQTPNVGGAGKKPATSKVYVGWTGMPSAVVGVAQQVRAGSAAGDRVEMDPQFAAMLGLGLTEGSQASLGGR